MAAIWKLPAQIIRCRDHFDSGNDHDCDCPQWFYQKVRCDVRKYAVRRLAEFRFGIFGTRFA
jgi:hypothetical protein